ncbi:MAG: inositol monophosphatase family protein [Gemmatimonadota bacterium]|nr:inositol monophosphatase family protein [Gemmatimonadota bacterium]
MHRLLETARAAADAATHVHRRDFGAGLASATRKARADYVSRTDLDAQEAALDVIRRRHPDHLILAEESDESVATQLARWDGRPLWIVDPLDGTANYLHGHPMHAASVAVAVDGAPAAGVVACGSTGERWWAARGMGTFKNGRRVTVSEPCPLIDALVGTGFPFKRLDLLPDYLGQFERVLRSASGIRRGGSAALDLAYLAQGALDVFWEEILMPWDFAAGMVLIQEAGGIVTGVGGDEPTLTEGPLRAANSPRLLDELNAVLGTTADAD